MRLTDVLSRISANGTPSEIALPRIGIQLRNAGQSPLGRCGDGSSQEVVSMAGSSGQSMPPPRRGKLRIHSVNLPGLASRTTAACTELLFGSSQPELAASV